MGPTKQRPYPDTCPVCFKGPHSPRGLQMAWAEYLHSSKLSEQGLRRMMGVKANPSLLANLTTAINREFSAGREPFEIGLSDELYEELLAAEIDGKPYRGLPLDVTWASIAQARRDGTDPEMKFMDLPLKRDKSAAGIVISAKVATATVRTTSKP